jgi:chromate transporter
MKEQLTKVTVPTLGGIGWVFARYANLTLGGGSATTAVLHHELLQKRQWLNDDRFTLCYALGRLTPGTNLLAFCTGVGWLLHGLSGAIVALLASSIPCAVIVTALTALFSHWQENAFAQAAGSHRSKSLPARLSARCDQSAPVLVRAHAPAGTRDR